MSYQSVNPFDGKAGKSFEELNDKQLEAKLETAANCFTGLWPFLNNSL
jgi:succinate-semialdehyde dehydrogenase/glutarate-semialdehyde dehydrogenase